MTEGGFGADLGAEKFVDIKCRKAGLKPDAAVIVATVRAIKYHGGVEVADLGKENLEALAGGIANLDRHIDNVRDVFGLPCLVAINHRAEDTEAEMSWLMERATHHGVKVIVAQHYAEGGKGAVDVAKEVVELCGHPNYFKFVYDENDDALGQDEGDRDQASTARPKSRPTARCARRSSSCRNPATATTPSASRRRSTPSRPTRSCAARRTGHVVNIREVRLAAGAEFVVMICGDIMTMPGLPATPAANSIDVTDDGKITGLF